MTCDTFRPHQEPARTLYDAFQAEAAHRQGRSFNEWNAAEIGAVHHAATAAFPNHGLTAPSRADVEAAQTYAMGSIDYGATWAYALVSRAARAAQTRHLVCE